MSLDIISFSLSKRLLNFHYLVLSFNYFMLEFKFLCRGQAEKEFRVEVEAIGHVRHKNLVRLLGYCIEGVHR